jgi:2-C-methyl-D-erythritol 2,4-cyclodiphosphate synthase
MMRMPTGAPCPHRIGLGNDLHRLAARRKLILGGVQIASRQGAVGHSDGDALTHAICDALLGAAGLGDIGQHFPDTSTEWRGALSIRFLARVQQLLSRAGFQIVNLDTTIGLERPKLAPYIREMREKLAKALGIRVDQISVKAKTGEKVDAVGQGKAVRADAIALVVKF